MTKTKVNRKLRKRPEKMTSDEAAQELFGKRVRDAIKREVSEKSEDSESARPIKD